MFSEKDRQFAADFLERVAKKVSIMAPQIGGNFPYTTNGEWHPKGENADISSWTNAFWPGMLWLMYIKTGDEMYKKFANECEDKLDRALDEFWGLHHDVGFMWSLSAVANYKLTENDRSRDRALHAATLLAGRFNPAAKFIRAWNYGTTYTNSAIIDCMMNLPLLTWAEKYSKEPDPRYSHIARAHADTVLRTFIRPDGSVHHIIAYDRDTGDVVDRIGGQGYDPDSSWSRGQAWAIYGYAMAYLNLGDERYLDAAKKVAHYFIANLEPGKLPLMDFRAPQEPVYYDSSAASTAVCGLIEIAKAVPEFEKPMYERAAMNLLRVLDENCNYDENELVLLENGSGAYHAETSIHRPFIFGDYYLLESLMKLHGNDGRFTIHN
ncbi:MAG: glycoside hydrolase family 88 protein [Oscillospiraceae bacterium]|nr:glycoside hydrolase family 88 protein [Oscillospiraceae bacterium]